MAQIRIDDEVYDKLKEAAEFNKRTVGQHILFLLDNELTFNEIRGLLVARVSVAPVNQTQVTPSPALQPKEKKPMDIKEAIASYDLDEIRKDFQEQLKVAKEREANRKPAVGDLTEEDLATAKVAFEERPDFDEPKEWDGKAWPTVEN